MHARARRQPMVIANHGYSQAFNSSIHVSTAPCHISQLSPHRAPTSMNYYSSYPNKESTTMEFTAFDTVGYTPVTIYNQSCVRSRYLKWKHCQLKPYRARSKKYM